jgi:alkanesulfonate monooxygenase SsuD/methylene tetrahydromethanopterin reductase-like flavin-dependent oxidoreductase (luciferase family)
MSRMAGEVCDGVHIHPFNSADYLRDVQIPNIRAGADAAGRPLDDVTLEIPVMTSVGDTDEELSATREHARSMIAFYGSTRTYSPVFEVHGFEGLSDKLHDRQRSGDFAGMISLITDDVLDHYIVTAPWNELGAALVDRYGSLAPTVRLMTYTASSQIKTDPGVLDRWADVARDIRTASGSTAA